MTPTYRISIFNNYLLITSADLVDFNGLVAPAKSVRINPSIEDAETFEFWNLDGRNTMWNRLHISQLLDENDNPFDIGSWETFYTINTSQYGTLTGSGGAASEATLSALNDKIPTLGQKTMALSSPVVIASNQSAIPFTQSGIITVQPGNAANTTPWVANPQLPAIFTTGDVGAKTSSGAGNSMNNTTSKGATIAFNIGSVSGTLPTCVFKIQGSSDGGSTWYDIPSANTDSLTATGVYGIQIYPGITHVNGTTVSGTIACVNVALTRTWRIAWTIGGTTPSFTITNVQVAYII